MFQIGDELRIPLGQQRRTVLAVCEGRAQFDVSTGGYVAVKWYTFAELRALNGVPFTASDAWEGALGSTPPASEDANAYPRPVRVTTLTAADTWDGDPANTTAPADESSYPRKPFTVVRLPAKELKVGDEVVGTYNADWKPEESWRVIGVQKSRNPAEVFIRWTRVVPTTRGDWFNTRTEAMWLTDWYKVKRSA